MEAAAAATKLKRSASAHQASERLASFGGSTMGEAAAPSYKLKRSTSASASAADDVSDAEVEEFYAILRRIRESRRGGFVCHRPAPGAAAAWCPRFTWEDFALPPPPPVVDGPAAAGAAAPRGLDLNAEPEPEPEAPAAERV